MDRLKTTLRSWLKRIFFKDGPPRKGCGTGIFFWKDKYFDDICIQHDEERNEKNTKLEIMLLDIKYLLVFAKRAIRLILKGLVMALRGVLSLIIYGALMPAFSMMVFLIKKK